MVSILTSGVGLPGLEKGSRPSLQYPPSPNSSVSSSGSSLDQDDEGESENVTLTANRLSKQLAQSQDQDLQILAISTHMTEVSYAISDIQTRIFEIQELRHKSQSSDGDAAGTSSIIDQSLMSLNERLESVSNGIKIVNDSLDPFLQSSATPTVDKPSAGEEMSMILRKHAALTAEWAAVQDESETLKEELKEDKWLTVFRTVTDQADGMMSSLEKAVNRCQDFLWQAQRRGIDEAVAGSSGTTRSDKSPLETFNSLLESFEAKKKHYMPATSKVLSIIDKGVKDRVTKNGETLRRHAESASRWKNLRERISRTDADMQNFLRVLQGVERTPSEAGSSTSGLSGTNSYLTSAPPNARSPGSLSRSMSPLKKFARKLTHRNVTPSTAPLTIKTRSPSNDPSVPKQRASILGFSRSSQPSTPITPDKPFNHKHSQSVTPESAPRTSSRLGTSTIKGSPHKQPWNSSTRVEPAAAAIPKRPPSSAGRNYEGNSSISSPYKRSASRTSMTSTRPYSPVTSSISTNQSTSQHHLSSSHTHSSPSRSKTPSRPAPPPPSSTSRAKTPTRAPSRNRGHLLPTPARAPSRAHSGAPTAFPPPTTTPRPRPETPSHIPAPSKHLPSLLGPSSDDGKDDDLHDAIIGRAFSPTHSVSAASAATSAGGHPPRPPSRSMIPLPSVSISSPSRPGTSMSISRSESPTTAFRHMANRAQTPEAALRTRLQNLTIHQGTVRGTPGGRASISRGPPSAFRADQSVSRPPSRSTSSLSISGHDDTLPIHEYTPTNPKDPLEMEIAAIANSIPHGLLIERMDPPLRKIPKDGEEIKAQYSFANALSRKVVTCKLTTMVKTSRATTGESTTVINRKVMCRVGGGWQDLSHYILNRQAGI